MTERWTRYFSQPRPNRSTVSSQGAYDTRHSTRDLYDSGSPRLPEARSWKLRAQDA